MDKEELLARRGDTADVPIGSGVVTVRALTWGEVKQARRESEKDNDLFEVIITAKALVSPEMTEEEVATWFSNAPAGDAVDVAAAITRLSKMEQGADKSNVAPVPKRRRR